jgi:hypothetical protein
MHPGRVGMPYAPMLSKATAAAAASSAAAHVRALRGAALLTGVRTVAAEPRLMSKPVTSAPEPLQGAPSPPLASLDGGVPREFAHAVSRRRVFVMGHNHTWMEAWRRPPWPVSTLHKGPAEPPSLLAPFVPRRPGPEPGGP